MNSRGAGLRSIDFTGPIATPALGADRLPVVAAMFRLALIPLQKSGAIAMQSSKTLAAELGNLGLLWGVPLGMFGASLGARASEERARRRAALTPWRSAVAPLAPLVSRCRHVVHLAGGQARVQARPRAPQIPRDYRHPAAGGGVRAAPALRATPPPSPR